jgi:hypothetical protein
MLACRERNQEAPVHYAARRRNDEPVSTAFVERSVNEIIARRMNKKQQMGWNRTSDGAALPRRANSGAERYARGRLPSSLFSLPPGE